MNNRFFDMTRLASEILGLPHRFVAAWAAAENGYEWPATNNPGNISYHGVGLPRGGIWEGVTRVLPNAVVVYDTPEAGVKAWCELISAPTRAHGGTKILTVDLQDLKTAWEHGGLVAAARVLGESNWAESHYDNGGGPGSLIIGAYYSTRMNELFGPADVEAASHTSQEPPATHTEQPNRPVHYVQPGETLSGIGLRYQVPWQVLARFNHLENPNVIHPGEAIRIPKRYVIQPGDTLTKIAMHEGYGKDGVSFLANVNRVNPDLIFAGHVLYV